MAKSPIGLDELFKGRHFEREIIVLSVRWYRCFKLSFRDLVEMIAERGLSLAHTTIMRWVQIFAPEFERLWNRFACHSGDFWRVGETYIGDYPVLDTDFVLTYCWFQTKEFSRWPKLSSPGK